uniref:AAA_23 domain-containing protein n=1 Tax=Angiostrongylus cantonensis TaxID=6313 RepID=A0A0K0CT67_ANGCA
MVRGVRSVGCSEEETQVIRFLDPLTIISGPNGSGKTTLIEALNYITTGALPSGKLASFVHSLEKEVCLAFYRLLPFLMSHCSFFNHSIQIHSSQIVHLLGVPAPILDNVIFCHQEESDWFVLILTKMFVGSLAFHNDVCRPLSEPKELKLRFDRIFQLTRFVKALEIMKKMKRDCVGSYTIYSIFCLFSYIITFRTRSQVRLGRTVEDYNGKTGM